MNILLLSYLLVPPVAPEGFTLSLDTIVTGAISISLGMLALINASKAKRERAAVEGHTVNLRAFEQARDFYDITNKRLSEQAKTLGEENERLIKQNRALGRQLDRLEELVRELGGILPDDWTRPQRLWFIMNAQPCHRNTTASLEPAAIVDRIATHPVPAPCISQ